MNGRVRQVSGVRLAPLTPQPALLAEPGALWCGYRTAMDARPRSASAAVPAAAWPFPGEQQRARRLVAAARRIECRRGGELPRQVAVQQRLRPVQPGGGDRVAGDQAPRGVDSVPGVRVPGKHRSLHPERHIPVQPDQETHFHT